MEQMSFEKAMGELQKVLDRLESGKLSLEQSLTYYEKGVALCALCEQKLSDAKLKMEEIGGEPAGAPQSDLEDADA